MFKLNGLIGLMGGVALAAATVAAYAAGPYGESNPAAQQKTMNEAPAKGATGGMMPMDMQGKGYVTKDEYMKYHQDKFSAMDTNRDGRIDQQEWQATIPGN